MEHTETPRLYWLECDGNAEDVKRRLTSNSRCSNVRISSNLSPRPEPDIVDRYQSSAIADITVTVGFLSAIMTVASQCLLPRAMFMKIMAYNLLSTCASAALCGLAVFCAVKAREHTVSPDESLNDYNSSACAISALWLMFATWFVSVLSGSLYILMWLFNLGYQTLYVHISHRNYRTLWLPSLSSQASL